MSDWGAIERVAVEVMLAEGGVVNGDLHLQARVAHREGPETPLELLNRADPFFALVPPEGGVRFLSKPQVAMVTAAPMPQTTDLERLGAAKRVRLAVTLVGGTEIDGWATLELPPTRARTLDFLNASDRFFMLSTDGAARYVHRAHVRLVRPLD
jgi:hypothetical protein